MIKPFTKATLGLVVILVGCGGASTTDTNQPSSTSASPTVSVLPPTSSAPPTEEEQAQALIDRAVDGILEAGSYAMDVEVGLTLGAETIKSELAGWVDGPDRELRLRIGETVVVTRVLDGIATVERGGTVTEVPLAEAEEAPSLELLRFLDQLELVSTTEITGVLDSSLLEGGFDTGGAARAVLHLTGTGELAGYSLQSSDNTWSLSVTFSDIGSHFR